MLLLEVVDLGRCNERKQDCNSPNYSMTVLLKAELCQDWIVMQTGASAAL